VRKPAPVDPSQNRKDTMTQEQWMQASVALMAVAAAAMKPQ
jgi:hypothetical protein